MGLIWKFSAIIVFIINFISTIKLGLSGLEFIALLLGCYIFCLLLYGVGEIIDRLGSINSDAYYLRDLYYLLKKVVPEEKKEMEKAPPKPSINVRKTISGGWRCNKCGTENESSSRFCKDCGEYK